MNIYCDESCHLEHDKQPVMAIGGIWCPYDKVREISDNLLQLKIDYKARGEMKWNKVSKSKYEFYHAVVKYFLDNPNLHFRCIVVKNKQNLNHEVFNHGSHDLFYYKMYFSMLKQILSPDNSYNIYLDIKDTRSNFKVKQLHNVLCNNFYDFTREMINKIQQIRSHESELLQLADLLLGAVSYKNRNLVNNLTKTSIVQSIEKKFNICLSKSTSLSKEKFNIFVWTHRECDKNEMH